MKIRIIEGKNLEEIKIKSVEEMRLSIDKLKFDKIVVKKGILGIGSSAKYEVSAIITPEEAGINYLSQIFKDMELEAKIDVIYGDESEITFAIDTKENPLVIGRSGTTLEALQFTTRNIVNQYSDSKVLVSVDVGNYKANRNRQLEILATKTAKEVAKTKIEVKLRPMNSFERRIVHKKLSEWRDVYTESVGNDPDRYLVIKPTK